LEGIFVRGDSFFGGGMSEEGNSSSIWEMNADWKIVPVEEEFMWEEMFIWQKNASMRKWLLFEEECMWEKIFLWIGMQLKGKKVLRWRNACRRKTVHLVEDCLWKEITRGVEEIVHSMEECIEEKIVSVVDGCLWEYGFSIRNPVRWNGPWDGGMRVGRNSIGDGKMHLGGNI
jgi:hypothetical protein